MTAGPPAVGDLFVCVYNDQQHFTYRDDSGNIVDAWYGTDGWHLQKINNGGVTAGPPAVGDLFVCVYNNQQHFTYRDRGGDIQDAWYGTDGWHLQKINNGGLTAGPPAVGDLFVCDYNNQQHFTYRDGSGNIQDVWYGTDGWHLQKINNGGLTAGPPVAGDLFVCDYNNQQHFTYRDGSGNIQDVWYGTDGWHLQKINNGGLTAGPPAVGDLFVCDYNNQQHFTYRDGSGNIQDVWYGTDGWHLQKINNGGVTAGPPAVGDLFVCDYNDQQHFTYRDGSGNILDAWYGTDGWHLQKINNGTTWRRLNQSPGNYASAMWLMQDGSVLANLYGSKQLMALRPDGEGSYANGSWSSAGDFLLEKWAFTSAVLSDGRLVACGGEYSGAGLPETETGFCEVYDPRYQSSTQFAPPPGWTNIGDSPSATLNDGTLLIGNTQGMGSQVALLDPSSLTWTFSVGDADNEQGYTLLQTGDVLTTGVYDLTSKRYDPSAKAFVADATLPVMLGAGSETGPGITLMDGRVIWFGASGHTCIYMPGAEGQNGTWVQGPDLPTMPNGDQLAAADVPAILEPNGMVFLVASGPKTSTLFLEYDPIPNGFAIVNGAPDGANREYCRTLLLPDGHGLVALSNGAWYDVTFRLGGDASWAPAITSFPATIARNSTVQLAGTQLCGLSECQSYGDDNQQAENYPMVRFVDAKGGVTYLRAHDVSTRSIAPRKPGTVLVDIPTTLAPAAYSVQVVAMGIPSAPGTTVNVVLQSRAFQAIALENILVLGSDGSLWYEQAPFGNVPPARQQVDAHVSTFQGLAGDYVLVLGTDANLWLEQAPFGKVPPSRQQVDANVRAFQALDLQHVFVLGADGNLWFEQAPFGKVPPSRQQIDRNARAFQALDLQHVLVLGADGNLWLEQAPFGNVPPIRQQVDANVSSFQGIDAQNVAVPRSGR